MTCLKIILGYALELDELQELYEDIVEYDRIRAEEEDADEILDNEFNTNTVFTEPKVLKNVELVRLSKKAVNLEDMLCHRSTRDLGLTMGPMGNKIPHDPDGLCFAFQKKYYDKNISDFQSKYGKNVLTFKVKEALEVEHLGDGERQVIFSPQAIIKSATKKKTATKVKK